MCVVYRKACVYPSRRLLSSCSTNLIFRMCFLNPSVCLSFQWQLSLSAAFTTAACAESIPRSSTVLWICQLCWPPETALWATRHDSLKWVCGLHFLNTRCFITKPWAKVVVKFGFIRLVTGICRASSRQGLRLWLRHAQSSPITYLCITVMGKMTSGVIFRLKDQAGYYRCITKLVGKHMML